MTTPLRLDERKAFHHEPLDRTQPSIRLVRIKPGLSVEGLIECEISHTTIAATYTCLSYRWGGEDPSTSKTILVNGQPFIVRKNLYDFLDLSCSPHRPSSKAADQYWIDAICIDQHNILERNHQVAQMGEIFAKAQCVHARLGRCSIADARCIQTFFHGPEDNTSRENWITMTRQNMDTIEYNIFRNEYWGRAWIIQEIFLARKVTVQIETCHTEPCKLYDRSRHCVLDWLDTMYGRLVLQQYGTTRTLGMPLIGLLSRFHDNRCSIPQDRAFSLLSICDEADIFPVDYSTPINRLAHQILTQHNEPICFCSTGIVARSLQLSSQCDLSMKIELKGLEVCYGASLLWLQCADGSEFMEWGSSVGSTFRNCLDNFLSLLSKAMYENEDFRGRLTERFVPFKLCDVLGSSFSGSSLTERRSAEGRRKFGDYELLAPGWRIKAGSSLWNMCTVQVAIGVLAGESWQLCSESNRCRSAHGCKNSGLVARVELLPGW